MDFGKKKIFKKDVVLDDTKLYLHLKYYIIRNCHFV